MSDVCARWHNGVVSYRWGSISTLHKNAIIEAMDDWSSSTGEVTFSKLPDTGWNNFQLAIRAIGVVVYRTTDLDGAAGNSLVGYGSGGYRDLNIDPIVTSENALNRVPRHEIGHVLGLKHEHQRYDRDSFVVITSSDQTNYGKLEKYQTGWRWQYKTVRILWWNVRIYYPIFWKTKYSETVGAFDFDSIMLYSFLPIQPSQGGGYTNYNTSLSPTDIETVKKMY